MIFVAVLIKITPQNWSLYYLYKKTRNSTVRFWGVLARLFQGLKLWSDIFGKYKNDDK